MIWNRLFGNKKPKASTSASPGICPNCKAKPVALNAATGQYFDYCSKTCAVEARSSGSGQNGSLVLSLCEQCKQKPKFRDVTKLHPYCGRTCAMLAKVMSSGSAPATPTSPTSRMSRTASSGRIRWARICQAPGCPSPVYVDANGTSSKYCTRTHKQWGERGCISCRVAPKNGTLSMCRPCHNAALRMAPTIIEVPEDHENYESVAKQFQLSWRHQTTCPKVQAVYKIVNNAASLKRYEQYKDRVEARGKFLASGKSHGNENRRWHGTKRKCNIGDKGVTTFCTDSGCSLCCIIKTSFDLRFLQQATGWSRFGAGIYTSSTSSKSNDYSRNESITSDWKALLLNKVVVGKGKKLTQDDPSLTRPPPGFDSVLAEVVPGGTLNYDELVVYDHDAARPSYLIMYESP